MTRDEAVEIQYKTNLGRHDGKVYHNNQPVTLLNLNYPQHVPQMARVRSPTGKGYWVELAELKINIEPEVKP